jgi:hypothetical protein
MGRKTKQGAALLELLKAAGVVGLEGFTVDRVGHDTLLDSVLGLSRFVAGIVK